MIYREPDYSLKGGGETFLCMNIDFLTTFMFSRNVKAIESILELKKTSTDQDVMDLRSSIVQILWCALFRSHICWLLLGNFHLNSDVLVRNKTKPKRVSWNCLMEKKLWSGCINRNRWPETDQRMSYSTGGAPPVCRGEGVTPEQLLWWWWWRKSLSKRHLCVWVCV